MKRTIPQLAEFLSTLLEDDPARVRNILRYCREDRLLSQEKPGPGAAAATPTDCARALFAVLGTPGGAAVHAPERLKLYLASRPVRLMIDGRDHSMRPTPRYVEESLGYGISASGKKMGNPVTFAAGLIKRNASAWRTKNPEKVRRVPGIIRISQSRGATTEFVSRAFTSKGQRKEVVLEFGFPAISALYHYQRTNNWKKLKSMTEEFDKERREGKVVNVITAECDGAAIFLLGMWLGGEDYKAGS